MPRCALISQGTTVVLVVQNGDPNANTKSGYAWKPCPAVALPSFDPLIEKITGPTYTIGADSVTEIWTKVSLTAQEIDDAKVAAINSINGLRAPILRAFYNVDKRLRVLEGAPAITFAQFKNGLPSVLP